MEDFASMTAAELERRVRAFLKSGRILLAHNTADPSASTRAGDIEARALLDAYLARRKQQETS